MHNQPGQGPTTQDKTLERMRQERESPGSTSAGGHGADAPNSDTSLAPDSKPSRAVSDSSVNVAARRGDSKAVQPTEVLPADPAAI